MKLIRKGVVSAFFSIFLIHGALLAQVVSEAPVKIGKTPCSGFIALSGKSKDEVTGILKEQLGAEGLKKHGKKHKFTVYKGVVWHVTGSNRVDLYYKVTGNKKHSKVYFIASKGYDNYITAANDQQDAASVTSYLSSLDGAITLNDELKKKAEELNALNNKLDKEKAAVNKTEAARTQKVMEVKKIEKTEAY